MNPFDPNIKFVKTQKEKQNKNQDDGRTLPRGGAIIAFGLFRVGK